MIVIWLLGGHAFPWGNVLMLMNTGYASANYRYCVTGGTLTLTPQTTGITTRRAQSCSRSSSRASIIAAKYRP